MGTISDKLVYLNTTKTKLRDAIAITGQDASSDTFRNYAVKIQKGIIDTMNDYETSWNNLEKVTGTNTSITLTPTEYAPIKIETKGNTNQSGTPTPSSPKQIHVVSGDNTIQICGKNFYNIEGDFSVSNITITGTSEYLLITGGTPSNESKVDIGIAKLQAGTYTITNEFLEGNEYIGGWVYYKGTWSRPTSTSLGVSSTNPKAVVTFTLSEPKDVCFGLYYSNTRNYQNCKIRLQIEKGSTSTSFTPYRPLNSQLISLGDIELCKIGTYQDYIYKDSGTWYLHKEVRKVVVNSSAVEGSSNYPTIKNIDVLKQDYPSQNTPLFKDLTTYITNISGISTDNSAIGLNTTGVSGSIILNKSHFGLTMEQWNTNYPSLEIVIYYGLQTAETTEITDSTLLSQLNNIEKLKSCNGTTNVSQICNDSPFELIATALKEV